MDRKKVLYIGLLFIITVIVSITYFSYAFFTSKNEYHGKINVVAGTLDYKIESSDLTNNSITLNSKESKKIEIEITSLNDIASKYELFYITDNSDIEIGYAGDTLDSPSGEIGIKSSKKVSVIIKNKTNNSATISFGVQGGFSHNQIALDTGRTGVSDELNFCSYHPGDVVKEAGYTGSADPFEADCPGNYKIELWGASGSDSTMGVGGKAGYVSGNTVLEEGTLLYLYIGNSGTYTENAWNGGGSCHKNSGSNCGSSGGGGVDIRTTSGDWDNSDSLRSRIMVAGSGGGAGSSAGDNYYTTPGAGGGLTGYASAARSGYAGSNGATQISAGYNTNSTASYVSDTYGAFGMASQTDNNVCCGAGGGSGWYGGGGGCGTSASGGSAYISGHTGCVAVTSMESSSPKSGCTTGGNDKNCSISPYGYTFTDTNMIDGKGHTWTNQDAGIVSTNLMPNPSGGYYASGAGHTGVGHARITYLGNEDYTITFETNGGNTIESKTIKQGNSLGNLSTAVKPYNTFEGWYLEDTLTTKVDSSYIPIGNITLYAKYAACDYNPGTVVKTSSYKGSYDTFTAPCGGNYKIELWGASGTGTAHGGYTAGTIALEKNTNLYIYVGAKANTSGNTTTFNNGTGNQGGYNGGGSTDIRYFSTTPTSTILAWNNATGLNSRIMVAGAGGSASSGTAGAGGGISGYAGGGTAAGTQVSYGGVQSSGYTASSFGIANGGCTGGNGYYPGGGATCASGAGGGSSYISGHTGCVAIKEGSTSSTRTVNISGCTTGTTNNECSKHYSGLIFTDTKMIDGKGYNWTNVKGSLEQMPNTDGGLIISGRGNGGNGYAKITYLGN